MKKILIFVLAAMCLFVLSMNAFAGSRLTKKQTVYAPALYNDQSSVGGEVRIGTTTRLIIRNLDRQERITLTSVAFYAPNGELVKEYLLFDQILDSLASDTFLTNYSNLGFGVYDIDGGRPCFIVKWKGERGVIPPIIESSRAILTKEGEIWKLVTFDVTPGTVIE